MQNRSEPKFEIVEEACTFAENGSRCVVVIKSSDSDARNILSGAGPKRLAMSYAAKKYGNSPGINSTPIQPYPVNAAGDNISRLTGDDGEPIPAGDPRREIDHYRIKITVAGSPFK